MNGLGALLFDGKFVPSQSVFPAAYKFPDPGIIEGDDLRKALGAIGVQYSHKNDEILVPSKIEAERAKQFGFTRFGVCTSSQAYRLCVGELSSFLGRQRGDVSALRRCFKCRRSFPRTSLGERRLESDFASRGTGLVYSAASLHSLHVMISILRLSL